MKSRKIEAGIFLSLLFVAGTLLPGCWISQPVEFVPHTWPEETIDENILVPPYPATDSSPKDENRIFLYQPMMSFELNDLEVMLNLNKTITLFCDDSKTSVSIMILRHQTYGENEIETRTIGVSDINSEDHFFFDGDEYYKLSSLKLKNAITPLGQRETNAGFFDRAVGFYKDQETKEEHRIIFLSQYEGQNAIVFAINGDEKVAEQLLETLETITVTPGIRSWQYTRGPNNLYLFFPGDFVRKRGGHFYAVEDPQSPFRNMRIYLECQQEPYIQEDINSDIKRNLDFWALDASRSDGYFTVHLGIDVRNDDTIWEQKTTTINSHYRLTQPNLKKEEIATQAKVFFYNGQHHLIIVIAPYSDQKKIDIVMDLIEKNNTLRLQYNDQ